MNPRQEPGPTAAVRAFLGVAPDRRLRGALRRCVAALQRQGERGLRWISPSNYHLTLVFLGELAPGDLEPMTAVLRGVTDKHRLFSCRIDGLGLFPDLRRPRVWVAHVRPDEPLMALQGELRSALADFGMSCDSGQYRPHLTLARLRRGAVAPGNWLPSESESFADHLMVDEVILYQSELTPGGANYRKLAKLTLGTSD